MLQPLSNSFLAEVLGISPRHLCLLSLPRGGLFPCVLYNLGHEVTSIQALSVETPEAWLVHLPLQSSFVVALPRSLGLAQRGATAMPISLGSLLPPNPPQSEGRPLTTDSQEMYRLFPTSSSCGQRQVFLSSLSPGRSFSQLPVY